MQAGAAHPRQCAGVVEAVFKCSCRALSSIRSHCCSTVTAADASMLQGGGGSMVPAAQQLAGLLGHSSKHSLCRSRAELLLPAGLAQSLNSRGDARQNLGVPRGKRGGPGAQALQVSGTSAGPTVHSAVSAGPPYDLVKRQGDEHQAEVVEGYAGGQKQSWRAQHSPEPQQHAAHAPQAGQRAKPASPIATRPFHCCSREGLCLLT